MHIGRRIAIVATVAAVAACGGGDGYGTTAGPGSGGGGAAGTVTVGAGIQYVSGHNGSMNPAVDTITAGTTVTWTWTGTLPHGVRSTGTPSFTSSETHTGSGTYVATFSTPGTYKYDCSVHGGAMTGTIVVLPGSSQSGGGSYDATAALDRSAAAIAGIVGSPSAFVPAIGNVTLLASSHGPIPEIVR